MPFKPVDPRLNFYISSEFYLLHVRTLDTAFGIILWLRKALKVYNAVAFYIRSTRSFSFGTNSQ